FKRPNNFKMANETNLSLTRRDGSDCFKSFKFRIEYPKRVTGYLKYLRTYNHKYNCSIGDEFDGAILSFVKSQFGWGKEYYSASLNFEENFKNAQYATRGGVNKKIKLGL